MASIFGYEITKKKKTPRSFAPPVSDDGASVVAAGGAQGAYLDLDGSWKNEIELINKYRDLQTQSEVDAAIDDIINDSIVVADDKEDVVSIDLENLGAPDSIKDKIHKEWKEIINLLDFNRKGYDLYRKWYVDGRIYFHMLVDEKKKKEGIQEVRYIDPRKIRKFKETNKVRGPNGVDLVDNVEEYFIYFDKLKDAMRYDNTKGIKIHKDTIAHSNSGLFDHGRNVIISHLHKAIKPINQLRMMEDAVVIYRISRSPERRIFYIDVGNLPKAKAEQYLKDTMNRYQNKLVYDANTGELKDDRKHMSMLEDFWLPRREGGRGTEISTLPGGTNLGEMEDVLFFQTKVYKALNVPPSRLDQADGFSLGRESEISRDELKFSKFIIRLRNQFSSVFDTLLRTQLVLRGIIKPDDWIKFRPAINYHWAEDSYYREIKNSELISSRMQMMRDVTSYAGRYFSMNWIKKNILQLTDEEVRNMQKEIDAEVDGGKVAQEATIEWGEPAASQMSMEPQEGEPPSDTQEDFEQLHLNGNKEEYPELQHINNLEEIIDEIDKDGN